MNQHLLKAATTGDQFRETLRGTESFGRTKWFDTLRGAAKPAVLALAMAAGATGCSTMSNQALGSLDSMDGQSPYTSMVQEAAELNSLPRQELAERIKDRQPSASLAHLEQVDVTDIAAQLADRNGYTTELLADPKALVNPFQPHKPVQLSQNKDWSTTFDIATGGFGMGYLMRGPGAGSPFALNGNHVEGAVASFDDPTEQSHIVVPERVTGSQWSNDRFGVSERDVAFTLYHELAHTTFHQEMMLYGGADPANTSVGEAYAETYKIQVESHANIAASMAIYKAYDMSPESFQEVLDTLKGRDDLNVLNGGMSGAPGESNGLSKYRSSKAVDVLSELVERDPDFLKNLSYEAMPLMAQDIVGKAGYFHNAAELIAETSAVYGPWGFDALDEREDSLLVEDVKRYLPDDSPASTSADHLVNIWKTHKAIEAIKDVNSALLAHAMLGSGGPDNRELAASVKTAGQLQGTPDLKSLIQDQMAEIKASQGAGLSDTQARSIHFNLAKIIEQLPSEGELSLQREATVEVLQEHLAHMSDRAKQADSSSVVAAGTGESAEDIAKYVQSVYGNSYFQTPGSAAPDDTDDDDRVAAAPGM